ncbi:unnamed protein product [Allacma fusca]|uniref:CHAT domain-containing protein n=1 Tax=Allacma fusca TaxID=39272 RepID=A0A8J2PJC6_9HEXA|nr:unnamed protein product [Allacma fusca]
MSTTISSEGESEASSSARSRPTGTSSRRQIFLDIVRRSNISCQAGDFASAVTLYSEALKIDPNNHILYSNRSAAFIKMGQFSRALQDALKARELNPKWSKPYYRQGIAHNCLRQHPEALAAFSAGLAIDPKSGQLLSGLMEAALKSPLKGKLEPTFNQLEAMKLHKSAFVVISVIGQELLAGGFYSAAVIVLESALKIGTTNVKLKGSVISALSSAYWALNSLEKAINYMQQDLSVAKSLGDVAGECRAYGNLGSAYFSKNNYKEALTSHRYQLVLAMKCKDSHAAAAALTSLGHVYTSIGDYSNALASHKQCVQLVKQMGDLLQEAREIGNVGAVYLVMGDFDNAIDCHTEHLRIAKQLGNTIEEARAYSNLGSSYHYRRNYDQAISFHNQVLKIAQDLHDKNIEARAYAGLGHAARCMGDYSVAKMWHEKQLDMALSTKDKVAEGRACSNLGIVFQLLSDHDAALKLHQSHLSIAISLHDRAGMGRAYGNIGNAYNAMGYYEQAIKYHKQELAISKEVNDRSSEASTQGNLAVAYQALGMYDKALVHYHSHLNISRELKDTSSEACALLNLGNCHSSHGDFAQAVPFYENYLMLSQELSDNEGEAKACHFLGYAHYSLGNFKEAVRYYDQDLVLAKDLQNKNNIARAYCNLGLTHLALGNLDNALECQRLFLAVSHSLKNMSSKFRALGNIGNILLKTKQPEEAIKIYQKQVMLAKTSGDKSLEGSAYGAMGMAQRAVKRFDLALGFHTQELTVFQEINDVRGECRAHCNIGTVHMSLGNYTSAIKSYEEMLERAKDLKDAVSEAHANGNLGIARINLGNYSDGINFFEQQLSVLESLLVTVTQSSANSNGILNSCMVEKGRALSNLGDCYSALGDHEQSIQYYERSLQISTKNLREQERIFRSLGQCNKALGNFPQATHYFEKRLHLVTSANSLSDSESLSSTDSAAEKAGAHEDLGNTHLDMGNFDQALNSYQQQLEVAKENQHRGMESTAVSNLGKAFHLMSNHSEALRYHEMDLRISEEIKSLSGRSRAIRNIGDVYESMGNFEQALRCQEQHLSLASQVEDNLTKATAFSSVGRVHHALGNNIQAVAYLQQALQIVEKLPNADLSHKTKEEEAKIRHFLGLALWRHGDLETALVHLEKSTDLLEMVRIHAGSTENSLALFDRQIASYQALQRILVPIGRTDVTLLVAEKSRNLANTRLKLSPNILNFPGYTWSPNSLNSVEALTQRINRLRSAVLYFSIAGSYLYSWLLIPERGIVKFHETCIDDENDDELPSTMGSLLEKYIQGTRDALGIDFSTKTTEGEENDLWSQHMEELGDKLNQDGDKTGFLRMVSRNHRFNCSSYSLSSLFSVGSATGSVKSSPASRPGSIRSKNNNFNWQGPSCLRSLYQMLIGPFEDELNILDKTCFRELVLVLETDLLLVPFPILRESPNDEYLCEKFKLIVAPSISSIRSHGKSKQNKNVEMGLPLVVGNPSIPADVAEQWGWKEIQRAENEAIVVAEILQCQPFLGNNATKENILQEISSAECVHFATHISWKLSAIILAPPALSESQEEDAAFSEYLLTAAEILKMRISAKLVVLSSCHVRDKHGIASGDGVISLAKALLAAGAMSVIITLWPVPEAASKTFFRALYSSLLQGSRVSHAITEAMLTVQHTKHFSHPANWSGYLLMGSDVQLSHKVPLTSQSLWELMKSPERSRDALRVTLHLVEKSLQRINNSQNNAMYTTQKSIENKVGGVSGWKDILMSVGFRFEPATNGLPAAVFFPQCDPGEKLTKASANLQALLGLSPPSLHALSKLLSTPEAGDDVISILRQAISEMSLGDSNADKSVEVKINVKLWGIAGCHELLASLGFDLIEVGENEVILGVGKHVNSRMLQLALQATLALFDSQLESNDNSSFSRSLSLESLELPPEELCLSSMPPAAYLPMRQQIPMGKGAFTSYVRSRGEPDGHTNLNISISRDQFEVHFPPKPAVPPIQSSRPSAPTLSNGPPVPSVRANYHGLVVQRNDSSSSGSSMTDWENGVSTVRRRAPPLPPCHPDPLIALALKNTNLGFGSRSDSEFLRSNPEKNSKKVTWKAEMMPESENKPWLKVRNVFPGKCQENGAVHEHSNKPLMRELPLNEVYHERNHGLGLAPPLSKLIMTNRLNLSQIETASNDCKSDTEGGAMSMDESLSTFDQLSLAEDSCAESSSKAFPPVARKRAFHAKSSNPMPDHKNLSINLTNLAAGSSSSSSKSSPSDLSRRDEGDGRSLTDSQYGSYSPSMAQNNLIQSAAAVYFASRVNESIPENLPAAAVAATNSSTKDGVIRGMDKVSAVLFGKGSNITHMVNAIEMRNSREKDREPGESRPRSAKHSPVRAKANIPVNLSSCGQKSSEC